MFPFQLSWFFGFMWICLCVQNVFAPGHVSISNISTPDFRLLDESIAQHTPGNIPLYVQNAEDADTHRDLIQAVGEGNLKDENASIETRAQNVGRELKDGALSETLFVQAEALKNQIGGAQASASLNLGAVGQLVKEDPTKTGADTLHTQTTALKDQIGGGKTSATENLAIVGIVVNKDPTANNNPALWTQVKNVQLYLMDNQTLSEGVDSTGYWVRGTQTFMNAYPAHSLHEQALALRDRVGNFDLFLSRDGAPPENVNGEPGGDFYAFQGYWNLDPNDPPLAPEVWAGQQPSQNVPWPFDELKPGEANDSAYIRLSKALMLIEDKLKDPQYIYSSKRPDGVVDPTHYAENLRELFNKLVLPEE